MSKPKKEKLILPKPKVRKVTPGAGRTRSHDTKRKQEQALEKLVRLSEELGLYDKEFGEIPPHNDAAWKPQGERDE